MNNEIDPFDDIQCEESIPEHWEGSPEPEPLSEEDLEKQAQEYAQKLEQEMREVFNL
jgi:predicted HAD superfamily Cof-like phosphohydrolase